MARLNEGKLIVPQALVILHENIALSIELIFPVLYTEFVAPIILLLFLVH